MTIKEVLLHLSVLAKAHSWDSNGWLDSTEHLVISLSDLNLLIESLIPKDEEVKS